MRDRLAETSDRFRPEELANTAEVERRLSRLWGRLIRVRSDKMLQKLFDSNDQGGG